MKKLMTLMLGLSIALGSIALAQDTQKEDTTTKSKSKKKGKKKNKKEETTKAGQTF